MGQTKRQALARRRLNRRSHESASSADESDQDNGPEARNEQPDIIPHSKARKKPSLRQQLTDKEARISELESSLADLSADFAQLQLNFGALSAENLTLEKQKTFLSATNRSLQSLKRKADTTIREELSRRQKRIKRLEYDRGTTGERHASFIDNLRADIDGRDSRTSQLENDLLIARTHISSRNTLISALETSIRERQSALTATRNRFYALQNRAQRSKLSLKNMKKLYKRLSTWNPRKHGQYSATARELARNLTLAGCSAEKLAFAVQSCGAAFGIKICRRFMSARTVGRVIDEGGKYGELQLAHEILEAPGFVESSDGTSHRGITVEGRHITLLVPSYAPGVDDSDKSTWKHTTRFVEVAPALDHTAQRQFEGTIDVANRLADTYNQSPLAAQDRRMDKNDYWRKKMGECRDHASDGKKAFELSAAHKKDIVLQDLGHEAMDEEDFRTSGILLATLDITDEDLMTAGKISNAELDTLSTEAKGSLIEQVLERKLGEEQFNNLTPDQQKNAATHVFGGCCSHKDMNVVKYGYRAVQNVYATHNLPSPVLLANKANASVIELSANSDSAAVQKAVDSSTSGAIKLLQLLGSLLRHKDGERGYQQRAAIYLHERKLELYGIDESGEFPDVSNNRYNCYTDGAREVVCFHGIINELIVEIIDSKTKSGQSNHVEKNILKGLNCSVTMTELVALALYGGSVSRPYMKIVRGTKDEPINMLSLTPLHRKLPEFCSRIADSPEALFDSNTPLEHLTIDGLPFYDNILIETIKQLRPSLPHLNTVISAMFSGCHLGWVHFTPESRVGGTFDCLTAEQRALLFIPTTNDSNEGILGTYRNYMKVHCNSTAHSFTNETRVHRNNTEAFIKKFCNAAVEKFVVREVRKDGKRGVRAKFRRAWMAVQREKAENGRMRRDKAAARKKATATRVAAINLELDTEKIGRMTSAALKDQLQVYKDVLKDVELSKKLWKDMATVAVRRELVLQARLRELSRRQTTDQILPEPSNATPELIAVDEFGFSEEEDADWEDIME